jgi:hypothetical protein
MARVAARSLATQTQRPKAAGSKAAPEDDAGGIFWKVGLLGLLASSVGVTTSMLEAQQQHSLVPVERPPMNKEDISNHPPARPDLPTFALEDIAEHCDESSLWYTFRGAVYDMTFFLHGHPGGEPVSLFS